MLSAHPLSSTRRGSQVSVFSAFRVRNNSEADFGDDECSADGDAFRSRAGSIAAPWKKRKGSVQSQCSQVFTPSLDINGRLNISLDQNEITTLGRLTPASLPAHSMERVREDTVSDTGPGVVGKERSSLIAEIKPTSCVFSWAVVCLPEARQPGGHREQTFPAALPDSDGAPSGAKEKRAELRRLLQRCHGG